LFCPPPPPPQLAPPSLHDALPILPATPPPAKGQPMSVVDTLGLRALVLFKRYDFAVFATLILLAMIPFQWYNVYGGQYLKEKGRSEEHTSELQSRENLVCRLLLEK